MRRKLCTRYHTARLQKNQHSKVTTTARPRHQFSANMKLAYVLNSHCVYAREEQSPRERNGKRDANVEPTTRRKKMNLSPPSLQKKFLLVTFSSGLTLFFTSKQLHLTFIQKPHFLTLRKVIYVFVSGSLNNFTKSCILFARG